MCPVGLVTVERRVQARHFRLLPAAGPLPVNRHRRHLRVQKLGPAANFLRLICADYPKRPALRLCVSGEPGEGSDH